ncbi:ABC transporter substrate-binding protein [Candidatus Woesearchaeota archaeon]|nr:ABC transporter substrate-binding protein [Candidatus Woesearchaeota archaeon]
MAKITQKVKILVLLLVVGAVLAVIYLNSQNKLPVEIKETVKIGFVADLSAGDRLTRNAFETAKIAVEDANKVYSKKFKLVVYDPKKNNKTSIAKAYKSAGSGDVMAIITLLDPKGLPLEKKLPTIYVGGLKDEDAERIRFYWNIRLFFIESDYVDQHIEAVRLRYGNNLTSAAFVTDNNEWLGENFTKRINSLKNIKTNYYLFEPSNAEALAKNVKEKNPDVVLLIMKDSNALDFLKISKKIMNDKLFLGFVTTNVSFLAEQESLPKRFILAPPPDDTLGQIDNPTNAFEELSKKLVFSRRKFPHMLELNTYDAVSLFAETISKSNIGNKAETVKDDREKIMKELWAVQEFNALKGTLTPNGITGYFVRTNVNTYHIDNLRFKSAKGKII